MTVCGDGYVIRPLDGQHLNARIKVDEVIIMAWSCSGTTNAELISNLLRNRLINSDTVAAVRAPPPRFIVKKKLPN